MDQDAASKAVLLKEEGNRHFQKDDFDGAEALYSKAIIADPKNPTLYTNRAMARLKLRLWDSVMADCNTCLELKPDNMKAFYYLSQAQLELQIFDSALKNALEAHKLCVETHDKSLQQVTNSVLRCKKERWEDMEKRRRREGTELEAALVALLERERDETLRACGAAPSSATDTDGNIKNGDGNAAPAVGEDPEAIKKDVMAEYEEKIANLRITFEKARANDDKRREVPDWAIDDISFSIMVDPVITKTGKSYERSSIMEHLRRHPSDPLTREPLTATDLRPNLGLKQACDEFLEANGWAVDW